MMKKTYLLAGISILSWSTLATVSKLLLGSLNEYQVLCVSALFAGLALLVVNGITGRLAQLARWPLKDWLRSIGVGLLGNFFYYICYYAGAALLPASQAFTINYLWPMMSVVFACILLGEKLTARKGIAIFLSFLGVFTVAGEGLLKFHSQTLTGVALCVGGAVFYGAFAALNKKYSYDKMLAMMLAFFASGILSFFVTLLGENGQPVRWELDLLQLLGLAWIGVITMAVANTGWALALDRGDTAKVSNLAYLTPFLSLVWTSCFLPGDPFNIWALAGLCVIVLGIFIQLKDKAVDS